jgi:hypothetical protein
MIYLKFSCPRGKDNKNSNLLAFTTQLKSVEEAFRPITIANGLT